MDELLVALKDKIQLRKAALPPKCAVPVRGLKYPKGFLESLKGKRT